MITTTRDILTIPCSFTRPPILKNDNLSRWPLHRARTALSDEAIWWVRAARKALTGSGWVIPITEPIQVRLVWTVTTARTRDSSGPQPTLDAFIDGLVRGGLIKGDQHQIVARAFPEIELRRGAVQACRVEITRAS